MNLSEDPDMQPILSGLFLCMYMVRTFGNLLIILAATCDSHLHTPMYFFLSNLSLADTCIISTMVPKVIVDIQTDNSVISYLGCLTQMPIFILFISMDDMLLTVMAYDQFLAICHFLHCSVIMNPCLCVLLVFLSFFISLLDSHILVVLQSIYFKDMEISNFFCHPSQVLNISFLNTLTKNTVTYFISAIFCFFPISGILFSYYKIVSSILGIPSSSGRHKAFSTCGYQLSVVCLFYGIGIVVYLSSSVSHSSKKVMVATCMFTVVTPMMNPFIYSLRNRDICRALMRLCSRTL
jgi:olfactory receptor